MSDSVLTKFIPADYINKIITLSDDGDIIKKGVKKVAWQIRKFNDRSI